MPLQAQTAEKLAERLRSHPSFEAEHKQRGHHQADQPGAAGWRFPQRRLRVAGPAIHGLEVSMYAAFGKPGAIRQAPDALLAVFTNRVENDNALAPQSHDVGPCSEGWLKSWKKSALQSTRSTAACPALRGYPNPLSDSGGRRSGKSQVLRSRGRRGALVALYGTLPREAVALLAPTMHEKPYT